MLTIMVRQVQPLRISKNTPSSTPIKMTATRPLSDIGATSQRRNSPSYNQATKVRAPWTGLSGAWRSLYDKKVTLTALFTENDRLARVLPLH